MWSARSPDGLINAAAFSLGVAAETGEAALSIIERADGRRAVQPLLSKVENVGFRCRVAGKILRSSRPPQNRTCELPRIRLKHLPARRASAAWVSVLDGTSGGRGRGQSPRWRHHDAPQRWSRVRFLASHGAELSPLRPQAQSACQGTERVNDFETAQCLI
jgi:hypothetical protein